MTSLLDLKWLTPGWFPWSTFWLFLLTWLFFYIFTYCYSLCACLWSLWIGLFVCIPGKDFSGHCNLVINILIRLSSMWIRVIRLRLLCTDQWPRSWNITIQNSIDKIILLWHFISRTITGFLKMFDHLWICCERCEITISVFVHEIWRSSTIHLSYHKWFNWFYNRSVSIQCLQLHLKFSLFHLKQFCFFD